MNPTTIAGWDVYPNAVIPSSLLIGGPIRRALSGKGYKKDVDEVLKVSLAFEGIDGDTLAVLKVIWAQGRSGSVSLVNLDHGISSTFLIADQEFKFQPAEGQYDLFSGSLSFEEV